MKVGVVGCGFVGLVTAACLAAEGHEVHCVERDEARLASIKAGKAPFFEPDLDKLLSAALHGGQLSVSGDMVTAAACDVIFLAVGTPTVDGAISLEQLLGAASELAGHLPAAPAHPVIVVKSTVVPGTTDGPLRAAIETVAPPESRFALAMNPEFLREGSAVSDFREPDRIVLGSQDTHALDRLREIYASYDCPVVETSSATAELAKYASNALLATLVSLMNDLATISEGLPHTDIETVSDIVTLDRRLTPTVGGARVHPGILSYLRAGAGFGGSCLPKDVAALFRLSQDIGRESSMLGAVLHANATRPKQVLALIKARLGSFNGKRVALLGLAFKPGTDDTRASVALEIAATLHAQGAEVVAFDPLVTNLPSHWCEILRIADSATEALEAADTALLVTAWPEFVNLDWDTVVRSMRRPLIVDARNALRARTWPDTAEYLPIGIASVAELAADA